MTEHKKPTTSKALHPETQMMSYGYDPFLSEGAVKPPVFLTSTFAFRTAEDGAAFFDSMRAADSSNAGLIYSRFNHPNLQIAEDRLALFEQGEAAAVFSSGMAAISTTLLALTKPGDVILRSLPLYGGTETLISNVLAGFGIQTQGFIDGLSEQAIWNAAETALSHGPIRIIFTETPSNPTNTMIDFAAVSAVADRLDELQGIRPVILCDNTLLGPVFQNPLNHGVDIVLYSVTKYIGGHSDLIAGAAIGSKALIDTIRAARSAYGTQSDPHSCWMIGRSLETVTLRMERASASARKIAQWLADQPLIKGVHHPDLNPDPAYQTVFQAQSTAGGSTFSFVVDGDRERTFKVLNQLRVFKLAVSLGGTESLVCHPASTTHSSVPTDLLDALGVSDSLVRLSIGLEHPDDLIDDLAQAMAH